MSVVFRVQVFDASVFGVCVSEDSRFVICEMALVCVCVCVCVCVSDEGPSMTLHPL